MTPIDTLTGWVRRLAAVIIAMTATTAALVGAPAPAGAATCSSSSGVSVVVDFTGATGGIQSVCVGGGAGQTADQVITSAGFAITWVNGQGFICRVNNVPSPEDDPCAHTPPADAYWGLFWSDGRDGTWHYADIGAGGLQVPDGGYIGLAWQTGTRREPGEAATAHPVVTPTATPTPTAAPTSAPTTSGTTKPTKTPTKNPTRTPTTAPTRPPTGSPTVAPTSTSSSSATSSPTGSSSTTDPSESATTETPSESPSSSTTESPSTSAPAEPSESTIESPSPSEPAGDDEARAEEESDRVPTWLTLTILASLIVAIGMSTYAARRRTHH